MARRTVVPVLFRLAGSNPAAPTMNNLYKYGIGETITFETDRYEGARWMDYQPIKITGKIVGVEDYLINAIPVYRVQQQDGRIVLANQNEIIGK